MPAPGLCRIMVIVKKGLSRVPFGQPQSKRVWCFETVPPCPSGPTIARFVEKSWVLCLLCTPTMCLVTLLGILGLRLVLRFNVPAVLVSWALLGHMGCLQTWEEQAPGLSLLVWGLSLLVWHGCALENTSLQSAKNRRTGYESAPESTNQQLQV